MEGPTPEEAGLRSGTVAEPGRRERRRLELREAVLVASEAELRTRGAGGFAVERVAAAADVAVQTVYNHFGGRDGLLLALAERAVGVDRAAMSPAYDAVGSPEDRVRAAAEAYVGFGLAHPEHFRLLAFPPGPPHGSAQGTVGAAKETSQRVAVAVRAQNARLAGALHDGAQEGRLRAVDPGRAATLLWAALNGLVALSWRADDLRTTPQQTEELLELLVDLLEHGLVAPGA